MLMFAALSRARTTHKSVGWAIIAAGIGALVWIVATSFDRSSYFYYLNQDRSKGEHPTGSVIFIGTAVVFETAVAYFVLALRRPWRVWTRALLGLGILVPCGASMGEFVIHAPGYWIEHLLWIALVIALLVLSGLFSGLAHAYDALARRRGHA